MKRITLLLLICSVFAVWSRAEVILDDTFNYSAESLMDVTGWTQTTTTSGDFALAETGLSYSNTGGDYILSESGKTMTSVYANDASVSNYRMYRTIESQTSGVVYATFLYKGGVNQSQSQSDVVGFLNNSNNGPRVWAGKGKVTGSTSMVSFGISRGGTGSANIVWETEERSVNDIVLVVLKHDLSSNTTSLYINPVIDGTEPATPNAVNDDAAGKDTTNRTSLTGIGFRRNQNNAANFSVSSLRISNTWAEAVAKKITGLPQLDTPVVGTASGVMTESFTANWTAVANAIGYEIDVYKGAELIGTYSAAGQATESLGITGLWAATTYTYTVTAKGDGSTVADSEASANSAVLTTGSGLTAIVTDFNDGTWGDVLETLPTSGSYPSATINDFYLKSSVVYKGSNTGPKGEAHVTRISVDKNSYSSSVTLPILASAQQIEIHANSGSDDKSFNLEKTIDGKTWEAVGTYNTMKAEGIYLIPVTTNVPVKFRISNNTSSTLYIWQIITRTTNPALLDTPAAADATDLTTAGFTANWAAVANATGYEIKVYDGTTLVDTYTATGQATVTYAVTGLDADHTYTYTVQAKGDNGVNYLDSYLSGVITVKTLDESGPVKLDTPVAAEATETTWWGFVANWTAVANATGYEVKVYKEAQLLDTYPVEGQESNSHVVEGLDAETAYTYTVTAKGDEVNYLDSDESAVITVTTGAAPAKLATPVALAATNETKVSFVANWETVPNAVGYNVLVYNVRMIQGIFYAEGQTATSLLIDELTANSQYTYQVQAVGDEENYENSDLSATISVTTLPDDTSVDTNEASKMIYEVDNVIYAAQAGTIEVYNIKGSKMLQANITDSYKAEIASGMYIVRLTTESGAQYTQKIRIK